MNARIVTREYDRDGVALGTAEAAYLARLKLDVRWDAATHQPRFYPGSSAGVVRLPGGRVLEIRPKVPLRNLLWMLEIAGVLDEFTPLDDTVDVRTFDDVLEVIAWRFARLVSERIALGLYRTYVEEEDNLAAVRGSIVIADDMRRNLIERQRVFCRFTTFSWDVPENQVLRQVVRMLRGMGFRSSLRATLAQLDAQMDEVTCGRFVAADVDRFIYNRQTAGYRPIHRLCRLFLAGTSLGEDAGADHFDGFLLEMNGLFERYVTEGLRRRMPAGIVLADQQSIELDIDARVTMRPDVVIRAGRSVVAVADCKYKRLRWDGDAKHADLYQMLAYTTALGLDRGTLIYARDTGDIDTAFTVRETGTRLREVTVSLDGTREEMLAALDGVADAVTAGVGPVAEGVARDLSTGSR